MTGPRNREADTRYTQDRELSWLRFNRRVLEEAWDEGVPLMERLKFPAISPRTLDEFFMVRVSRLLDLNLMKGERRDSRTGMTPAQQLAAIFKAVGPLCRQRDKVLARLSRALGECGVSILRPGRLEGKDRRQMERYFRDYMRPILSPVVVDTRHPFPHLPSKSLALALTLRRGRQRQFGLVLLPRALPPCLFLDGPGLRCVLTEQIALTCAASLFPGYQADEACIIAVTRSADLPPEDEEAELGEDFRQHMKKVLKKRARLAPVRLEIQGEAGEGLSAFLCRRLGLTCAQVFRSRAPLRLDFVEELERRLPPELAAALCWPPHTPRWPAGLDRDQPVLPQVLRRDVLLRYPYHSMDPFLRLIREAGRDPKVVAIRLTVYRVAAQSRLLALLAEAAENGKEVTVLMELRARFDEQNNIAWAERLEEAGCTVLYGCAACKVHAKICLITRRDRGRIQYLTQIGTGNYNEKTARQYTDFCLMTAHPGIGADAAQFFQNMATSNLRGAYRWLLASPFGLKRRLLALIDREIARARAGRDARIFLKVNALTDRQIIDRLVLASQAGVEVVMNIRGICCLRPGLPGVTDHIRVFSLVGRWLEHTRIYVFGAGRDARIYLSSADLMTRNTERRVELACPVLDGAVRRQVLRCVDLLCRDSVKARRMGPDGRYAPAARPADVPPLDAQAAMLAQAVREEPLPRSRPSGPLWRLLAWGLELLGQRLRGQEAGG